jgi:hypothetical protein
MTDTKQAEQSLSMRSPDFKYIPCDAVSLAISDDGLKLILGVNEADGTSTDLVGVHMSHKTAMALKAMLSKGLDHFQQETGTKLEEPDLKPEAVSTNKT